MLPLMLLNADILKISLAINHVSNIFWPTHINLENNCEEWSSKVIVESLVIRDAPIIDTDYRPFCR